MRDTHRSPSPGARPTGPTEPLPGPTPRRAANVAVGVLSRAVKAVAETDPGLVSLDEGWERLEGAVTRLMEWSKELAAMRGQVGARVSIQHT